MRVVRPNRHPTLFSTRAAPDPLLAATSGLGLVVASISIAYLTIGTHLVDRLAANVAGATIVAALLGWTFAVIAPTVFGVLGAARLLGSASALRGRVPVGPATAIAASLPDDYLVAGPLTLPDGRAVPELVVGPHGVAVLRLATDGSEEASPWTPDLRGRTGNWRAIERAIERTVRDAERVRRWLGDDDTDFVVRIHALVVTDDPSAIRAEGCAVVPPDRLSAYLEALPAQRTLTAARRERVERLVEAAAQAG